MLTHLQQPNINGKFFPLLLRRVLRWKVLSILLLGFCSNLLVNVILDLKYQRPVGAFSLEETFNAIIAAVILLRGVRWITKILDRRIPWEKGAMKRLFVQLGSHLVFLVFALNLLLIFVTYLFYGGFYTSGDLLVINISVVSLAFLFSIIDTGIFFFSHWRRLEFKRLDLDKLDVEKPLKMVAGRSSYLIDPNEILYAKYHAGLVMIVTRAQQKYRYGKSLDSLMPKLNNERFFRANRQTILNRSNVNRFTPIDHGKIMVEIGSGEESPLEVIVSRSKAAKFRKWISSNIET